MDIEELKNAVLRIERRLGGQNLKLTLDALDNKDFAEVANITLNYYDKTYTYGIDQRTEVEKISIDSDIFDPVKNAKKILEISEQFLK